MMGHHMCDLSKSFSSQMSQTQAGKNVTFFFFFLKKRASQVAKLAKNLLANAGDTSEVGSISG